MQNRASLKKEITSSINKRLDRIRSGYVTKETPPRNLFDKPDKFNVNVENVRINQGGSVDIEIRAMFAFSCLYLSEDNTCLLHPTILERDIRPHHCEDLGTPGAKQGEKGFCRIIDAAIGDDAGDAAIDKAIELEISSSDEFYLDGKDTLDEAAELVTEQVMERVLKLAPDEVAAPSTKVGRNEPCSCGSGKKFKKCCGA